MSLAKGEKTLATEFNSIRTRVIAEFNTTNRRNIGSNYKTPAAAQSAGNTMNASNVNNIALSLYYVNSNTFGSNGISAGTTLNAQMNTINTALTTFEGKPKKGSDSGCKSGCIGLCQGCTGGCQNGCTGGCESGCSGGCQGGCGSDCSSGCGGCSGLCRLNCTSACASDCDWTCYGGSY